MKVKVITPQGTFESIETETPLDRAATLKFLLLQMRGAEPFKLVTAENEVTLIPCDVMQHSVVIAGGLPN